MVGSWGERGGVHPGEQVLGPRWGPAGGGVGDPTTPLEDKGQGGECEREQSEKEEDLGVEGAREGRLVGTEHDLEVLVVGHVDKNTDTDWVEYERDLKR